MTNTFALGVEYDGEEFHGFQSQNDVSTVQGELEKALSSVGNQEIKITAAGRTDAGVHATQQVVSFRSSAQRSPEMWCRGVNSLVGEAVAVTWCQELHDGFNARFDATARRYVYVFYQNDSAPALLRHKVSWTRYSLDHEVMNVAAQSLVGEHDFSSFRASACQSKTPYRCVHSVSVVRRANQVVIDITANAFLLHMVRNIVGCLEKVGRGEQEQNYVSQVLKLRDRTQAAPTAEPDGLYLVQVKYSNLDVEYRPPPTLN